MLAMTNGTLLRNSGEATAAAAATDDRIFADKIVLRIERLGELHKRVSRDEGAPDLVNYLRAIAKSAVVSSGFVPRTYLKFEMPRECLAPERTVSLVGLAVNELVLNAVKYSHP